VIVGNYFVDKYNAYEKPIPSSKLGIFKISNLSTNLKKWEAESITCKYMVLDISNDLIAMPILHTIRKNN
jgi:hypothetical protein